MIALAAAALAGALAPPTVVGVTDFSASDHGWISAGQTGQWEWGIPVGGPGGPDPSWGTYLAGNYLHDTVDTLTSPPFDLVGVDHATLVLHHWYEIAAPDAGWLEVDGGSGFVRLDPVLGYPDLVGFDGSSGGYVDHVFDLRGHGTSPRVQLVFSADLSGADAGWYVRALTLLDGDGSPPVVAPVVSPTDTQDLDGPYPVTVSIQEEGALLAAVLHWRVGEVEASAPLTLLGGDLWSASLPGMALGTEVAWWVTACDGAYETRFPTDTDNTFRVFLAAPTGLALADDRAIGQQVTLTWEPPASPEPVRSYELWRDGALLGESDGPPAVAAVELPVHAFEVRARFDVGTGDPSETLLVEAEIPTLRLVEPASAWPGDDVRVRVEGTGLYLVAGTAGFDFGPDVRVVSVAVDHADAADIVLDIDDEAAPGPRRITLASAWGPVSFAGAFTIDDQDTAPAIASITPPAIAQRETLTLTARASLPFAGPVEVDPGPDLVLTTPPQVEGDAVTFGIAVSGNALPGPHTLVFDDGVRLLTASVEVTERVLVPDRGCAHTAGPYGWPAALGLLIGRRPRGRPRVGPSSAPRPPVRSGEETR